MLICRAKYIIVLLLYYFSTGQAIFPLGFFLFDLEIMSLFSVNYYKNSRYI